MSLLPSPLVDRLVLGLASGLLVVGTLVVGSWVGPVAKKVSQPHIPPPGPRAQIADPANGELGHGGRTAVQQPTELPQDSNADVGGQSITPGDPLGRSNREEDATLLTALQRLERQMAVGMLRARDSVVALEYTADMAVPAARRVATGVVINSRGDVLSVRIDRPVASSKLGEATGREVIVARDASGRRHLACWVAADPESGLTLLRISARSVRPIEIAVDPPELGSQVFVVGNPFGLGHTVSRGHIAGLDRALKLGTRQLGGLIQIQAPLYPGDSGAVVANFRGQLLGLIRSGLAIPAPPGDRGERDNDFGFAIAARDVLWVADQLRARGHVDRAYLGVRLETTPESVSSVPASASTTHQVLSPLSPELASERIGICEGALLREVLAGTPAAQAGLQIGDIVVAVNGELVRSASELTDRLDRLPAQVTIQLEVVRGSAPARQHLILSLQTTNRPDFGLQAGFASSILKGESDAHPRPSATSRPLTVTSSTSPAIARPAATTGAASSSSPKTSTAVKVSPRSKNGQSTREPEVEARTPVSIPPPVRSPLRAPVPPPQGEELKLTLPRAVADRLERIERRLDVLERQNLSAPTKMDWSPRSRTSNRCSRSPATSSRTVD
jgi:S1-C subfamily serine protease